MFGSLPIRVLAGIAFIVSGLPKFENIAVTQGFFQQFGLPPELAFPIGLLEVIGEIFLLVGVVTRITAALFVIEMIGATLIVGLSQGFVGGYELTLLLMAICTSLLLTGPGRISIEWDVLKREMFPRAKYIIQDHKDAVKQRDIIAYQKKCSGNQDFFRIVNYKVVLSERTPFVSKSVLF